ncbi:MAG: hypothetical protein LLG00_13600 [Planctomycetaceae bacterium]|nr:hypothetical protein [Planctomycetaceae bacterium]
MSDNPSCLISLGDDRYQCGVYGFAFETAVLPIRCHCERAGESPPADFRPATKGPGDHLHDAIMRWAGEVPTRECGCADRIAAMNQWGPSGCREHIDEIVGWLLDEASKRGWWRYAVAVPGSRYFIKRMVLGAIKSAELDTTTGWRGQQTPYNAS